MKGLLGGISYLLKISDIYTKTHFPYLYYQTTLMLTRVSIGTSPKYPKNRHNTFHIVYLDTIVEGIQFGYKPYQLDDNHPQGGRIFKYVTTKSHCGLHIFLFFLFYYSVF